MIVVLAIAVSLVLVPVLAYLVMKFGTAGYLSGRWLANKHKSNNEKQK